MSAVGIIVFPYDRFAQSSSSHRTTPSQDKIFILRGDINVFLSKLAHLLFELISKGRVTTGLGARYTWVQLLTLSLIICVPLEQVT